MQNDSAQATDDVVLVFTSFPGDGDASAVARHLVEERLVACVNIVPAIRSVYRWKDNLVEDNEQLLILKTRRARLSELQRELTARHPYEVPEIMIVTPEGGAEAYFDWVRAETR